MLILLKCYKYDILLEEKNNGGVRSKTEEKRRPGLQSWKGKSTVGEDRGN